MMMTQKMKVSKNVADAIDLFLTDTISEFTGEKQAKAALVAEHYGRDWTEYEDGQYSALNEITSYDLMKCMMDGYEPEHVKEEKGPKYLKIWEGVITGSMAGRDDGFPETKYSVYNSLEDLSRGFRKNKDERYYKLERINDSELEKAVNDFREKQAIEREKERKIKIKNRIKELEKELETLENSDKKKVVEIGLNELRGKIKDT